MRVNVYAEELGDPKETVEIISKTIDGIEFTGLRMYLYLPVTTAMPTHADPGQHCKGPFIHRPGDDDSAAITIWGKTDLRPILSHMLDTLKVHYASRQASLPDGAERARGTLNFRHGDSEASNLGLTRNAETPKGR